jgi:tetratricopeptide (TPR) repeat protein
MKKIISWVAAVFLAIFCLLVLSFIPPFNLLLLPFWIMLEPKPETLANQGVPIAQAIVDYQNEHGAFPEKISGLVPKYLPKEPSREWSIQFNGQDTDLTRHGGQPHSYIRYWFTGYQAGQWRYYPDSADKNWQLNIPASVAKKAPLTGEALFIVQIEEYEKRIAQHPHEIWYFEDKICFLGLSNRADLLVPECERAAKEFPDWWLPQMTLAMFSPTNSEAGGRFESWVKSHGSHVNYWFLARYYREKGETSASLEALSQLAEQSFVKELVMSRWDNGTDFLFDASKYAYENQDYPLVIKLAKYWETKGRPRSDQAWLQFVAATELKSGQWNDAIEHARKILEIARKDESLTANLEQLLKAAEVQDTNFVFQTADPERPWTLFRSPTP